MSSDREWERALKSIRDVRSVAVRHGHEIEDPYVGFTTEGEVVVTMTVEALEALVRIMEVS